VTDPDLHERVAAELEIRNVLARIAQTADAGSPDEYLALFTDDAVWDMPENLAVGLPGSTRRGRDDLLAGVEERRRAGLQGPGTATRHLVATVSVDVEGADTAVSRSYWSFWAETTTAPVVRSMGEYLDRFRRTTNGWKLAHRTILMG
jgi:uncharacterized protein (TIGR02246 family)